MVTGESVYHTGKELYMSAMVRPRAESIIFSGMAFGKQAAAGHCRFEGQSPLLPIVFAWQACEPSLLFPRYQKEQPIPGKSCHQNGH